MAKKCNCTCAYERQFIDSVNVSYWRREGDDQRWPKYPTATPPIYRRVYSAGMKSPYCIYALVHCSSVQASSLVEKDQRKFNYEYGNCDNIFADYVQKLKKTEGKAKDLKKQLCLESVVPKSYIDDFKCKVDSIVCGVLGETGTVEKERALSNLQSSIATLMKGLPVFTVREERQLNTWLNDLLSPIISSYGFIIKQSFPSNTYSIFGTSQPDFAFFKVFQRKIVATAVEVLDENEENFDVQDENEENVNIQDENEEELAVKHLVQGTIEYKRRGATEKCRSQCYANMVRVANDIVIESLECGILVDSVTVYGLLVSHSDYNNCVPMKYYSNFRDLPTITLGPSQHFAELIYCILEC